MKKKSPASARGPPLRCNRCHKLGHTANKCLSSSLNPSANMKAINCLYCRRDGHDTHGCWQRQPGLANIKAVEVVCFNCGRKGHFAKDCRQGHTCSMCGRKGHTTDICRVPGKDRSGNEGRESPRNPTVAHPKK
jgi:hypothetical protein